MVYKCQWTFNASNFAAVNMLSEVLFISRPPDVRQFTSRYWSPSTISVYIWDWWGGLSAAESIRPVADTDVMSNGIILPLDTKSSNTCMVQSGCNRELLSSLGSQTDWWIALTWQYTARDMTVAWYLTAFAWLYDFQNLESLGKIETFSAIYLSRCLYSNMLASDGSTTGIGYDTHKGNTYNLDILVMHCLYLYHRLALHII